MMKKLLLLLLLSAVACSDRAVGPERTDTDAIQVAYLAELIEAEPFAAAAAYCISTGPWASRVDPSDDVLNDLRRLFGKTQPGSKCVSDITSTTYNGEPARTYHVESITRSENVATAVGFYRQNALEGAYYEARLEKQGSFWVVTGFEMTAVW
jgi:hypothetical protein